MAFLKAVAQGLLFVLLISVAVVVTVRWGLVGILVATLVFVLLIAVAFGRRSPHDERTEKPGHDWYEV